MLTKKQKVRWIIHAAAVGAASVGGGLAQLPTADTIPITALQVGMVQGIALLYGRELREASAASIVLTFTAGLLGRAISQLLVGWVPVLGNAINAATAASFTEAVGWAAHAFFERLGNESVSEEELAVRARAFEKNTSAQEQPSLGNEVAPAAVSRTLKHRSPRRDRTGAILTEPKAQQPSPGDPGREREGAKMGRAR